MEISKKDLQKLSSLPDDQLREKILAAASSCGVDGRRAEAYMSDMTQIKKKLASLSDAQIRMILSAIGEENVRKIKESINDGSGR